MAPTTRRAAAGALTHLKASKSRGVTKKSSTSKLHTTTASTNASNAGLANASTSRSPMPRSISTEDIRSDFAIPQTIPISELETLPASSRKIVPTATTVPLLISNDATTATIAEPIASSSATASTDNILSKALSHLIQIDPRFAPLIEKHPCPLFTPGGLAEVQDPFASLCSGVISQQVSGAAAKSIKAKFIALFTDELHGGLFPSPEMVLRKDIPTLRTAGLSERKAEYVLAVAQAFVSKQITAELLAAGTDSEVTSALTAIRGIGQWSAEMFLMFCLRRWDVFSTGDLGIARGMAAFAGMDVAKLKKGKGKWKYMPEKEMKEMAERYRPYRSFVLLVYVEG
ncbi:Similar to DNA-3-methyladenine glycosylase; acc. no. P22134 [Pyronema omphalodes CBS 100304]|uniref:Similar to DNA-3-methyladenine glycosylase acc. no. P22134 n=1 Tax=Pyronema omphalodes (strain CBS 100304) TaxID=1076935 RepID=U4KUU1_PYROM|nr:Similar to DNA-3-methyladenine glycosylase; acc. no. P22134 [Pyronema omphalodes CBS 100304]